MLAATLAAAGQHLGHLERAEAATGRLVATRARGRAPKRSGRLASSLSSKVDGATVAVGSGLVYAPVIHNGWPAHHIHAHPFLVPVAQATEPVWRGYYVTEVQATFNRVRGA